MQKVILASKSPRRIELLKKITNNFIVSLPSIDETIEKSPFVLPLFLSLLKVEDVLKRETGLIIAADTVVKLNNQIFSKPKNHDEAVETLKALSNKTHEVLTGVCIAYNSVRLLALEKTFVEFNKLSLLQIEKYIEIFHPYDKAGSYGIQDNFPLINSIQGDYDNVVGLPVNLVRKLLDEIEH